MELKLVLAMISKTWQALSPSKIRLSNNTIVEVFKIR
jgi:hypothetical protein